MPSTTQLITSTPYWLRYTISYDGTPPSNLIVPNAQLIADSKGFLRKKLAVSGLTGNDLVAWVGPDLEALVTPIGLAAVGGGPASVWGISFQVDSEGRPDLYVEKPDILNQGVGLVQLRLVHTMFR